MKAQEFEKMEIEAKTFACSLLSDSSILSKKREKQIREYLKKNNFLKSDSESSVHQKIKQFKTAVCFNNMYINKANDILISLSDGKYDFLEDKSNSKFFDFEPNDDFKELTKNMKQTNKIMEHLQKEEESLHEKRKDDPELDKNMKDFEKKMFKNPKFTDINGNPVDLNNLDFTTDREERLKKERENNKNKNKNKKMHGKHENKNLEDAEFNFKDLIAHPELLRKYIGIKTVIGFIIFMIIITYIDNKNQKRIKEEEEKNKKIEENKTEEKKEENKEKKEVNIENKVEEKKIKKNNNKKVDNNKDETIKEKVD